MWGSRGEDLSAKGIVRKLRREFIGDFDFSPGEKDENTALAWPNNPPSPTPRSLRATLKNVTYL